MTIKNIIQLLNKEAGVMANQLVTLRKDHNYRYGTDEEILKRWNAILKDLKELVDFLKKDDDGVFQQPSIFEFYEFMFSSLYDVYYSERRKFKQNPEKYDLLIDDTKTVNWQVYLFELIPTYISLQKDIITTKCEIEKNMKLKYPAFTFYTDDIIDYAEEEFESPEKKIEYINYLAIHYPKYNRQSDNAINTMMLRLQSQPNIDQNTFTFLNIFSDGLKNNFSENAEIYGENPFFFEFFPQKVEKYRKYLDSQISAKDNNFNNKVNSNKNELLNVDDEIHEDNGESKEFNISDILIFDNGKINWRKQKTDLFRILLIMMNKGYIQQLDRNKFKEFIANHFTWKGTKITKDNIRGGISIEYKLELTDWINNFKHNDYIENIIEKIKGYLNIIEDQ